MGKEDFIEKGGQESGRSSEEQGEHPFHLQAQCVRIREKALDFVRCRIPRTYNGASQMGKS